MDPLRNPFSPGAGAPPPELAGRDEIIQAAHIALARIRLGRPEKSQLLLGLRGVGKTVLRGSFANDKAPLAGDGTAATGLAEIETKRAAKAAAEERYLEVAEMAEELGGA